MRKKRVLLLGSVPMSLSELALAPAVIGAEVKQLGHDFEYHDINLLLFELCNRDHVAYVNEVEFLQDKNRWFDTSQILGHWFDKIDLLVQRCDCLLLNVFSMYSHVPSLRLAARYRQLHFEMVILMGGLGSNRQLLGGVDTYRNSVMSQLVANFDDSLPFGEINLQLGFINAWQKGTGVDILYEWLPQANPMRSNQLRYDFTSYRVDQYEWPHGKRAIPILGSQGCVRQCSFCDVIKYFPRYSFVEADDLTKTVVETCASTGVARIQFMDSLVNGSMTNFLSLLKNLAQARQKQWLPEDFAWSGTYICRPPSSLLDDIHEHLAPSGAETLVIGIETGSDRVRFEMEKKFTNNDLLQELEAFRHHGIQCRGLFFPSWPTETDQDFNETLRLFERMAEYGQNNTVESLNLGTNGFVLIDGTPIDRDRDRIGLEPGPLPWLWKCNSNPNLTFYQTLHRRLIMAEWCEMLGINLDRETEHRRHMVFNLDQHRTLIQEYVGSLKQDLSSLTALPRQLGHVLKMQIINSGMKPVTLKIGYDGHESAFVCQPGHTDIVFEFDRDLDRNQSLLFNFDFDRCHETVWQTYDTGDYYDRNGVYLNRIIFDWSDMTFRGWSHMVDVIHDSDLVLPDRYYQNENRRCVTKGISFCLNMPIYHSVHKTMQVREDPAAWQARCIVDRRMEECFDRLR